MTSSGGIGFMGVLTIIFITLKIVGEISWSWWWVVSPMWLPLVVVLFISAIIGLISALIGEN